MKGAYVAKLLPEAYGALDYSMFMEELIDATSALAVYMEKIKDSKVRDEFFLPIFQQKEAMSSLMIEGTQTTLDGILVDQLDPDEENKSYREVGNYLEALWTGIIGIKRSGFTHDFFKEMHKKLFYGNVRKSSNHIGEYRRTQNYIARKDGSLVYTPPKPEDVFSLMENLISYINSDLSIRPLVRIAIIHAQFETIHPFCDGNGRMGRILIPLYLFAHNQVSTPFFFISEMLERDKYKYYQRLMDIREKDGWNEWIRFFLETIVKQCKKQIGLVDSINSLYNETRNRVCAVLKSRNGGKFADLLFQYPVLNVKIVHDNTGISLATVNRYLNTLVEEGILFTDGKQRYRNFFFYDLLGLIRE